MLVGKVYILGLALALGGSSWIVTIALHRAFFGVTVRRGFGLYYSRHRLALSRLPLFLPATGVGICETANGY